MISHARDTPELARTYDRVSDPQLARALDALRGPEGIVVEDHAVMVVAARR